MALHHNSTQTISLVDPNFIDAIPKALNSVNEENLRKLKDFFENVGTFLVMFLGVFADLGEIGLIGRKYRPRSPFCPGRWAENFFEKLCLVPLLLEFWIFNNRLIF